MGARDLARGRALERVNRSKDLGLALRSRRWGAVVGLLEVRWGSLRLGCQHVARRSGFIYQRDLCEGFQRCCLQDENLHSGFQHRDQQNMS